MIGRLSGSYFPVRPANVKRLCVFEPQRCNKHLTNPVFPIRTVSYGPRNPSKKKTQSLAHGTDLKLGYQEVIIIIPLCILALDT